MDTTEERIYTAIIITSLVLGFIITYFVISMIRSQRKNLKLHRDYMTAEIAALEKDRSRIAADLHDDIGPVISAIKMKLNSFELTDEDLIELENINNHIDSVLQSVRRISFELMPASLIRKGIVTAVKEFTNQFSINKKIQFRITAVNDFNLPEVQAIHVYRLLQEIIHNAVKHSNASEVAIEFDITATHKRIQVTDNGSGFDYDKKISEASGMGLGNIFMRSSIIQAETRLRSLPGEGTQYSIQLPVSHSTNLTS